MFILQILNILTVTTYRDYAVEAAKYTDNEKELMGANSIRKVGTAYIISPYHAKTNLSYKTVQDTNTTVKATQGYSLADVKSSFLYDLAKKGISGKTIDLSSDSYSTNVKKRIVADLNDLLSKNFPSISELKTEDGKEDKKAIAKAQGYVILGVYLHLTQDMYAHRATVTYAMVTDSTNSNYINKSDFKSTAKRTELINILKAKSKTGKIPMIRLKDYLSNNVYEDTSTYWPERIEAAESATAAQIERVYNGDSFSFSNYDIDIK